MAAFLSLCPFLLQIRQDQFGYLEVDDEAGTVHQGGDEGAETTAGSMRRRSTMGITEATVALQSTMATMVRVTTMPISGPTPGSRPAPRPPARWRPR